MSWIRSTKMCGARSAVASRVVAVSALALWLAPGVARALPESPGMLTYQKVTEKQTLAGKPVTFDLYIPKVATPAPVVALGHGFMRGRLQMAGWGKQLASRGYVAAALDFPGADHGQNGKVLAALLDWVVAGSNSKSSPLAGKVDGSRRGVMGHSAGGLAAVLAAAADAKIDVVIGLDPVDAGGLGKVAAAQVKVPVLVIRAAPGICNSNGNAATLAGAVGGPLLSLQVIKATHCDPEWDSDVLCSLACGLTDPNRQARFRRYAMATLDHVLLCKTASDWLGGARAKADTGVTAITAKGFPPQQLGCARAPDAGAPDAAPAKPDMVITPDLPGGPDAAMAPPPDGTSGAEGAGAHPDGGASPEDPDAGCGCAVKRPATPGVAWPGVLLACMLLARRRRGR